MRIKIKALKTERDQLLLKNKELESEIILLHNRIAQMMPSIGTGDTGSQFPLPNELQRQIYELQMSTSSDLFFDVLSTELTSGQRVAQFFKGVFEVLTRDI